MVKKCFFFFLVISGFCSFHANAQSDDFCNAVNTIIRDAPNKFRNVRGKTLDANNSATIWDCSIKVPGVISARFVASRGLFYEGAFFQTANIDELSAAYDKYKAILNNCLAGHGYVLSYGDNFYPGLISYKKLIFMIEEEEDPYIVKPVNPPPHVAMEATYSKEVGKYTIVMYIFEH